MFPYELVQIKIKCVRTIIQKDILRSKYRQRTSKFSQNNHKKSLIKLQIRIKIQETLIRIDIKNLISNNI